MEIIADLHLHSRFSRATSKNITISNLVKYAKLKGLNLLGTGDFTHPLWLKELKEELTEEDGTLHSSLHDLNFLLATEISLIYTQGKPRRIHLLILAPNFEIVEQINKWLGTKGRLDYDGRPIFGFSCPELVENMMSISKDIEIIPAHCLTPWYGIFGSMSGFDSIHEAFQDKEKYIHAVETGLSADPEMMWKISSCDRLTLISNSDAHSFWPWRIGREANLFDLKKLTYKEIIDAIRNKENKKLKATIEVDPAYGKYHYDGHRICDFSCSPEESVKLKNICPKCKKSLTIGVEHRVEQLADKPQKKSIKPKNSVDFYKLLPLTELISKVIQSPLASKRVWQEYNNLIQPDLNSGFSEFDILLKTPSEKLRTLTNNKIVDAILQNREGKIKVKPGYDGVYGQAILGEKQAELF